MSFAHPGALTHDTYLKLTHAQLTLRKTECLKLPQPEIENHHFEKLCGRLGEIICISDDDDDDDAITNIWWPTNMDLMGGRSMKVLLQCNITAATSCLSPRLGACLVHLNPELLNESREERSSCTSRTSYHRRATRVRCLPSQHGAPGNENGQRTRTLGYLPKPVHLPGPLPPRSPMRHLRRCVPVQRPMRGL